VADAGATEMNEDGFGPEKLFAGEALFAAVVAEIRGY
jgi:hypothetical protein